MQMTGVLKMRIYKRRKKKLKIKIKRLRK